jgi:hypothetical protein
MERSWPNRPTRRHRPPARPLAHDDALVRSTPAPGSPCLLRPRVRPRRHRPVSVDEPGVTQRELLMEMRDDIRALRSAVASVARDQTLSVERRASMQRVADTITARLDSHEKAILDLQRWRDEAAGAIRLARWALGASLVASALMVLQIAALISHAVNPAVQ